MLVSWPGKPFVGKSSDPVGGETEPLVDRQIDATQIVWLDGITKKPIDFDKM